MREKSYPNNHIYYDVIILHPLIPMVPCYVPRLRRAGRSDLSVATIWRYIYYLNLKRLLTFHM